MVLKIIQSRRQDATEHHDLLSMLLAAQDEEPGEGLSDRQLQDEVITLISAGHETTATTPNQTVEIDPRFTLRPKYGIKATVQRRC